MKLEKYVDKESKRRKAILITISAIVLISASFLLYKTFASFTESAEFPMMKGKVDYFGNSDIYFAFYNGEDEQLDEMPQKGNEENLVFDRYEKRFRPRASARKTLVGLRGNLLPQFGKNDV